MKQNRVLQKRRFQHFSNKVARNDLTLRFLKEDLVAFTGQKGSRSFFFKETTRIICQKVVTLEVSNNPSTGKYGEGGPSRVRSPIHRGSS